MASESVGKISLDLEIQSDIKGQISSLSQSIGSSFKQQINSMFKGTFSGLKKQTSSGMEEVSKNIKSSMSGSAKAVKDTMTSINDNIKNTVRDATSAAKKSAGIKTKSTGSGSTDDALVSKYNRQTEAVKRQQIAVDELKKKYNKMLSGEVKLTSLKNTESELKKLKDEIKATEQEYNKAFAKMQESQQYAQMDTSAHGKVSPSTANTIIQLENELDRLGEKLSSSDDKAARLSSTISQIRMNPSAGDEALSLKSKLDLASDKLSRLRQEAQSTESKLNSTAKTTSKFGNALTAMRKGIGNAGTGVKKLGGFFSSLIGKLKQSISFSKRTQGSFGGLRKSSKGLGNGIMRLGNMFRLLLVRMAMRQAINGAKEGFQNLAQYSGDVNSSISSVISALTRLKNSFATAFAPILNVVAPILTKFINMLSDAMNYLGMFFAALTGQSSYTKALGTTTDYAASLSDAADSANDANSATQEYQKTLMGFDSINKLESQNNNSSGSSAGSGGSGSGVSDMFETVSISGWASELANSIKDIATRIFEPIKQAWEDYGGEFVSAWKEAFDEVKNVAIAVGATWLAVWENGAGYTTTKNILLLLTSIGMWIRDIAIAWQGAWDKKGYALVESFFYLLNAILELIYSISESYRNAFNSGSGQQMLESIFQIATDICNTVGNLATQFMNAWNSAGLGNDIAQGIFDIFNIILETIQGLTGATAEWAQNLDFTPLLSSVNGLLQAIKPLTQNIGDGLVWFYENALLPIGSWVMQDVVPAFLDMLSGAISVVNAVIDELKPIFEWLWNNFLSPIASWTGGVIVTVLEGIASAFEWIANNEIAVTILTSLALAVGVVATAAGIWSAAAAIASVATTAFGVAVNFLTSPITLVVLAIAALIAIIILVVKNFDTIKEAAGNVWDAIVGFFSGIADWFKEKFEAAVDMIKSAWDAVVDFFAGIWQGIKDVFNGIKDWFKEKFENAVKTVISIWIVVTKFFSDIWDGIKSVFNNIGTWFSEKFGAAWDGIKNAFSNVGNFFGNIWSTIKNVINSILGGIEGMANGVINGINTIIKALNKLNFSIPDWIPGLGGKSFGFNIGTLSNVSLPRLATGGIIDTPTLAMVGENGQEAVVPLENNTGWIDNLASMVAAKISSGGMSNADMEVFTAKMEAAISKVVSALNNLGFYIGDEELARAVQKGTSKLNRRQNTVTITG